MIQQKYIKMLSNVLVRSLYRQAFNCSASPLATLRKKTGYSIKKCKEALALHQNNVEKAEEWLDEIGQKEGWAKAEEMKHRKTLQGLVGVSVQANAAALVEVNCETDFVARNEQFIALTSETTKRCLQLAESQQVNSSGISKVNIDSESLRKLELSDGKTLGDLVALTINQMKENMSIRRATLLRSEPPSVLQCTTHPPSSGDSSSVAMGKYASVVAVKSTSSEDLAPDVPVQLCRHVIGMNPKELGSMDEEEKEPRSESSDEEEVKEKNKDDETRLLQQEFLLDQDISVRTFLKDSGCEVLGFHRYECGESLET